MMKIYASGTLKAFLDARSQGVPEELLRALQSADEASRIRRDGNVIHLPDRKAGAVLPKRRPQ
jgi:hypothetical protein